MSPEEVRARAAAIRAAGPSAPFPARDPVNQPMIHNWVEAIGDANPVYVDEAAARAAGHDGVVAPPAMLQVWTMPGLHRRRPPDDPLEATSALLDEAGYTAVVATNCRQRYRRYLRLGEHLAMVTELVDVVGPKQTSLGEGWFLTTRHTWSVGTEAVAEMDFRMLKYVAPARPDHEEAPSSPGRPARAAPVDARPEGVDLPPLTVAATPTFIIASALATRDFQDVHHDRDRARGHGARDIFVNILTDTGLVQRVVTDWAGPAARLHEIDLRLRVPCYAYDTLEFTGRAVRGGGREHHVHVVGRGGLGDHVTGTVLVTLPSTPGD